MDVVGEGGEMQEVDDEESIIVLGDEGDDVTTRVGDARLEPDGGFQKNNQGWLLFPNIISAIGRADFIMETVASTAQQYCRLI